MSRSRWSQAGRGDDRGGAPLEMAILAPVILMFLALILYVGQLNVAASHVGSAARSAARSISLERDTTAAAVAEAEATARANVAAGTTCVDTELEAPDPLPGPGEELTVQVSCEVRLSGVVLLDVPGSQTVTAQATEIIDHYRRDS